MQRLALISALSLLPLGISTRAQDNTAPKAAPNESSAQWAPRLRITLKPITPATRSG
jgi:hypothetical protein